MSTPDDFKSELYDWNMLTNAPKENSWIKDAWRVLTMAMISDPGWAWSVHCNLAMPIMDTLNCSHIEANNAAAILMKHIFNYDVTQLREFKDICQLSESEENTNKIDTVIKQTLCKNNANDIGIISLGAINNRAEETYIVTHLKPRESLSDKFDPDYAKFGIRNKDEFIKRTPTITNRGMSFQMKVKDYFIEHAYYSNEKYPWVLFSIGESLNNDSTLFKTIKVGNFGDMERTLIIPNDELNFDDFKLVLNPAEKTTKEASVTCDASDFLSNLTNRIKLLDVPPVDPCDKDHSSKGIESNRIEAHREKVLSFFKHGMTYLKKHRGDIRYIYRDDMSSHKKLVFECESGDSLDGAFRTVDLETINLNDWQAVEDNKITKNRYIHDQVETEIDDCQSFEESDYRIDDIVKFCRKFDVSLITAHQSPKESDELSPIETMMGPITHHIKQLNPETKESLLKFLKIRSFFKPQGVYKNKRYKDESFYIYQERQPRFDELSFKRKSRSHYNLWTLNISCIDINDWVLLGVESSHIDPKECLYQKVKSFFKQDRLCHHGCGYIGLYFSPDRKQPDPDAIIGVIYDRAGNHKFCRLAINKINLSDWT